MRKVSELIGMQVIDNTNREKICKINDILYSKKKNKIIAFKINKNAFVKDTNIIEFDDIVNIQKDLIILNDKNNIKKLHKENYLKLRKEGSTIVDFEVICEDGEIVGYVKDILINEKNGKILGYILTDGMIQDILSGRNILPIMDEIKIINNSLFITKNIKESIYKNQNIYKKNLE